MRITITSSILALALSSVCAQAVMAAPRPLAPSMSSPPVGNTAAPQLFHRRGGKRGWECRDESIRKQLHQHVAEWIDDVSVQWDNWDGTTVRAVRAIKLQRSSLVECGDS
jgi:hypothetical protein